MTILALLLSLVALGVAFFAAATVVHTDALIKTAMQRLDALEKDLRG